MIIKVCVRESSTKFYSVMGVQRLDLCYDLYLLFLWMFQVRFDTVSSTKYSPRFGPEGYDMSR